MGHRAPGKNGTPHRPTRDARRGHELADLKRENNHLRVEVSKLRREIDRLELLTPEDLEPEPVPTNEARQVPEVRATCPLCGSTDIVSFTTPMGTVRKGCKACQRWRGEDAA